MLARSDTHERTGGQILVDQLLIHGADCGFCVPGESYLEVLDALHDVKDRFTLYNARHEAGAANMAEAHGKLTGRPGIAMVTRGPGACHAAIGVHIARQDSTPMILLIGQVGRGMMDREAFQEVDYRAMFGGIAKWVAQIDSAERIPEYLSRAFRTATSGRPGPVVLALPEDMLTDRVAVADAPAYVPAEPELSPRAVASIRTALEAAERPMVIVGGGGWSDEAARDIRTFVEAAQLPVAASFRRQDILDNGSDSYVGDFGTASDPALTKRLEEADLLLVLGARLGEMTTKGYTTLQPPVAAKTVIHVHADADEIGRVYAPAQGFVSAPGPLARALADETWPDAPRWAERTRSLRSAWLEDTAPQKPSSAALDLSAAFIAMRELVPADAVVTLDAGNHAGWAQRFLRYGRPGRQIGSTCGSMGYSVPAAVSAALLDRDRPVIGVVGDGGFMMSGLELATAVQHGARPVVLLINNGSYGTIRMHQEREHPGRLSGTDLGNPDFIALAQSLGCDAERVTDTGGAAPALERALKSDRPAVIELVVDVEQISSRTTLSRMVAATAG